MTGDLLKIIPEELKFPFELKKQISASLTLVNQTTDSVAFKVKTTSPKKYCVRPNTGVLPPQSTAVVTVTMQAQREAPADMQCKDKFLVQSVIVPEGGLNTEVSQEMFNKEHGDIHEAKLKVIYSAPAQPPSPVAESSEEGPLGAAEVVDDGYPLKAAGEREAPVVAREKFTNAPPSFSLGAVQSKTEQAIAAVPKGWTLLQILVVALLAFLMGYFWGQTTSVPKEA